MKSKSIYIFSIKVNGEQVRDIIILADNFDIALQKITNWSSKQMNKGHKIDFYFKGNDTVWE